MSTRPPASPAPNLGHSLNRLIRKEWTVFTPRDRFFVFGIFFLTALQAVPVEEAFFLLGVALAVTLLLYVPVIEWYQESDSMLYSFPVSRDAAVLARYLIALMAGGLAGLIWTVTGRILLPILAAGRTSPSLFLTFEGGLTFLLTVALVAALLLPLYFGFGVVRGGLAFLGLSSVLLPLSYATAGMAWGPAVHRIPGLIPPSHLVSARVSALISGLGPAGALTVILVATAGLFWVSLLLSQRLFRRREF